MKKKVDIYVLNKNIIPLIHYVQYSTEIPIEFQLMDYIIPQGAIARYYIKKPSGLEVYNECQIQENSVILQPTAQTFAESGRNQAQIQIVIAEKILVSFVLNFEIEKNIIENSAIPSSNEFGILDSLILQAQQELTNVSVAVTNATNAAANADSAAVAANAAAQSVDDAAEKAITAAGNANSAAQSADGAKDGAVMATVDANDAAEAANEAANKVTNFLSSISQACSKVLWTGTADEGQTIVVPDVEKYSMFLVDLYSNEYIAPIICVNNGSYIIGGQLTENISADKIVFNMIASLQVIDENVKVYKSRIMAHSPSAGHNASTIVPIKSIIGLIPDFSKFIE